MNLRVRGIYNIDTVRHLQLLGINEFCFDLRPRSLNFIQIRNCAEIISNCNTSKIKFFIQLEDDKDFVIKETINQFKLYLEDDKLPEFFFIGIRPCSFYTEFNMPFSIEYSDYIDFNNIEDITLLRKVFFSHDYLESLMETGALFSFISDFQQKLPSNVEIGLSHHFGSPIMESIVDFIPFKSIQFEITNLVELSFRNIDLISLNNQVDYAKKSLGLKKQE